MTRPLRIEYPGAWYHVTSRGNERAEIFRDDKDRRRFLQALEESIDIFNVEVHSYVEMSNHFHFLLRTREANLGRFMQRFNTAYTAYFNLRHHRAGHLYQGRYKAILVDADEYLLELSRYLHLNPVRLKGYKETSLQDKGKVLEAYVWSSLPGYIGLRKRDKFVTYSSILECMGGNTKGGKERYRDFVIAGLSRETKNILKETQAEAILGTDSFITWVKETFIEGKEWEQREYPHVRELRSSIPVDAIAGIVSKEYGTVPGELLAARSPWREARQVLIELVYRLNFRKKPLQELGRELGGIGGASIAHTHKRVQKKMMSDKRLSQKVHSLHQKTLSQ
ncbi:MAG: transposase [Chlamydiota bacterium]